MTIYFNLNPKETKIMKKACMKPFFFFCLGLAITSITVASVRIALERPSPPRNLTVSSVTATTCVVSYQAPVDDGGTPIISYEIESYDDFSSIWISRGVSTGLSHEVINMKKGSLAKFRITASNKVGKSNPVETNVVLFEDKFIAR